MLAEKVNKHSANVWLINTGWSGGKYGIGKVIYVWYSIIKY